MVHMWPLDGPSDPSMPLYQVINTMNDLKNIKIELAEP